MYNLLIFGHKNPPITILYQERLIQRILFIPTDERFQASRWSVAISVLIMKTNFIP